jgi:hypothetical protein
MAKDGVRKGYGEKEEGNGREGWRWGAGYEAHGGDEAQYPAGRA